MVSLKEAKNICCEKGEGEVDHRTVTRWLKKFCFFSLLFYAHTHHHHKTHTHTHHHHHHKTPPTTTTTHTHTHTTKHTHTYTHHHKTHIHTHTTTTTKHTHTHTHHHQKHTHTHTHHHHKTHTYTHHHHHYKIHTHTPPPPPPQNTHIHTLITKNLDDLARSGKLKIVDVKAVLLAIRANLANSTWRASGEFGISQSSVIRYLQDLGKKHLQLPNFPSHYQNIAKLWLIQVNIYFILRKYRPYFFKNKSMGNF